MRARIDQLLSNAKSLKSGAEIRQAVLALMRIILQHACISLAEYLLDERTRGKPDATSLPLERLRAPSDGTLVSTLADLLIAAENYGWEGVSKPFWQPIPALRPCASIASPSDATLEAALNGLVRVRNSGVEGHGIPGDFNPAAELDLLALVLDRLDSVIPVIDGDRNTLYLATPRHDRLKIQLLRAFDGDLICYRNIKRTAAERCTVRAQRQTSLFDRVDVAYEAPDLLGAPPATAYAKYEIVPSFSPDWTPFVLLPDRLTDFFTGREDKIRELQEWSNDVESRACMLFGDGGIGKTTVAIEFVHRLLEGRIASNWHPELITFYTAKRSRWGLTGVERLRAARVGVADAALAIVQAVEAKPLERDWFTASPERAIQKVAGFLRDFGIDRTSHLLILDNTETMADNKEDVDALATQIQDLSRSVGRVLLTSRRREAIEARPIEVKPLEVDESVKFLRERARSLNREQAMHAGNSTLRKYADGLGNRPLALEVFIQALGEHGISLARAFDRVLRMQRQDLGEFLYADAWTRMSPEIRHLLLLMTRVIEIHDDFLLKLCCNQVGVGVIEADDALEASRGITNIATVNGSRQIVFSPEFLRFCEGREVSIKGTPSPTDVSVETVRRRYGEFLKSATAQIPDRVSRAFRHVLARAAWRAFQDGRDDDCELFYEEATVQDAENGWLYDRYAYFLFSRGRLPEALAKAITATKLIDRDPEAWFTRGIIEARLRQIDAALHSLDRAEANGKPKHLCSLQKAYAYLNASSPDKAKGGQCVDESEKNMPSSDAYYWKHKREIQRIRTRYSLKK